MSWESLFSLVNGWALLGWVALAFLPRGPRVLSMILYAGVALLCLAYTIMFGGLLVGGWEAGLAETPDFSTLTGVMALFDAKAGAVLGWTHYLAFDLFTGLWIARDADQKGFSRVVQFPFLLLTLLVGPVGLFAWLVVRERRARALAKAT
jgi:hypothetical protein